MRIIPVIIVGKVFDKCIANIIELYLVFHENQFGFLKNGGCGRALFAVVKVVVYFRERSKLLCCSLEISKAFGRTNYLALLQATGNNNNNNNRILLFYKLLTPLVNWGSKPTCPERIARVQSSQKPERISDREDSLNRKGLVE